MSTKNKIIIYIDEQHHEVNKKVNFYKLIYELYDNNVKFFDINDKKYGDKINCTAKAAGKKGINYFSSKFKFMKNEILPYNPHLKEIAKQLRQNMTLSEVLLWNELKQKKIQSYDFDRQKPKNTNNSKPFGQ